MKLISLNIEKDKHIALIVPFIQEEKPDVVCFQELYERDFFMFKKVLGMHGEFAPMTKVIENGESVKWGIGILAKKALLEVQRDHYALCDVDLPVFVKHDETSYNRLLLSVEVEGVRIGTTHFTWTPDGEADDVQRNDLEKLLEIVGRFENIVFCGDFNAPRGREIFSKIRELYADNIPTKYETSIDGTIHRAGQLNLMVDGCFSTPGYRVRNVSLHAGVSDHMAIIADVGITENSISPFVSQKSEGVLE